MVGVVRDIVIPVKGDPVFTIVCEILETPAPTIEERPHVTRLWKMASAWRVISFFVVVFVLPAVLISLPLYARYHLYPARHFPMTETDTRALNHAVSSFWCQGQRVTSNGTLDAFLVAGSPRVQEQRRHVTLKRNLTLQHDDIEYWGVYLLQGSSVALSTSARWPGGVLLVVQSEENLRKCFYRENRLESELNDDHPSPGGNNVYKSPPDQNDLRMDEERHWDNWGGEVFDDETDRRGGIRDDKAEVGDLEPDDDLVPILPDGFKMQKHKYHLQKSPGVPKKRKQKRKKNKKGKKGRHLKTNANQKRSNKSQAGERVRRDAPELSIGQDDRIESQMFDRMELLHRFNDTVDVTTGNSSFSSSEEFLEQCRNSVLTIDITPFIDWERQINNLNADNPHSWSFAVNTSDYYYFIFTSDNSIELNHLGFNLELQRATYDVSSALDSCRNSKECVFPLAFTQTEAVVVEVPAGENFEELHSFEVTTTCQPRVPVYMVFILLVPFIILLFAFQ